MSNLPHMCCGASGAGHGASKDQYEDPRKRTRSEICKDSQNRVQENQDEAGIKRRKHNLRCQASRKRVKQDKEGLKGVVGDLKAKNDELEMEITSLDQEESMLSRELKLLDAELEVEGLNVVQNEKELADQNEQLTLLSTSLQIQPVISIFDLEGQRTELEVLTQITTWEDWESEKSELMKKISDVETENLKLQTEHQALVEMIVQDSKVQQDTK